MTLGQTLKSYLEKSQSKQAHIAASWLEAWKKSSPGKSWSQDTIVSNLNRCLQELPQGIRFFFITDRTRGTLLLELLGVPPQEREAIFVQAGNVVSSEGAPPQLIIDATSWSGEVTYTAALFEAIERQLVAEGPLPIALLILEEQFKHLPRTYDALKERDKVRFERFKDVEEAWARVEELADEQGLVLSARRFMDFERWLATEFDGRNLRFEPSDGLTRFRQVGRLPSLPEVVNDLSLVVPAGQEASMALPSSPHELRRLMVSLRSEEGVAVLKLDARMRQGYGLALGIAVASTPRERLEAERSALAQKLPVALQQASAEQLKALRVQAARRGIEPTALRVGDEVHLLNLDAKVTEALGTHPWLHVEQIAVQPSPLHCLLQAVSSWTEEDFLYDPFLEHLIERLDPEKKERFGFLYARAGLLLNQALPLKAGAPVKDWEPALEDLLAADPPEASVRVRCDGDIDVVGRKRPAFVVPESLERRIKEDWPLRLIPPLTDVIVGRGDRLVGIHTWPFQNTYEDPVPELLLPKDGKSARDTGLVLELYEAENGWRAEEARPPQRDGVFYVSTESRRRRFLGPCWEAHRAHLLKGNLRSWDASLLEYAPSFWEDADRELAMAWLALRLSVPNAPRIRLPDGAVLLQVGPGVLAEIRITQRTEPQPGEPMQASLLYVRPKNSRSESVSPDFMVVVPTHAVEKGYAFGPSVLRGLHIRGERFYADIRFRASALFSTAPVTPVVAAAASAQARDEEEAEKEAQAWDDDD